MMTYLTSSSRAYFGLLLLLTAVASGDDDRVGTTGTMPDASVDLGGTGLCAGGDADEDTIATADEGSDDADMDGLPNAEDTDSDGDSIPDIDEAGDRDCATPPVDTDDDGIPDFLDLDSNGDGTPDALEGEVDTDGDGIPDRNDPDIDGDGLDNGEELDEAGFPVDTDEDGVPDLRDLDSDGDTILDADERLLDPDGDGIPAFRDLDSDGDGLEDIVEAGAGDTATAPVTCPREVDPTDPTNPAALRSDGFPDFADIDQDNDGASDAEELEFGTDLCGVDTDGDGFSDVAEIALERINCPDGVSGEFCGCATQSACGIPEDDFFLVLPFNGRPQEEDLDFATDIRVADIFFLTDTTGSMSGTIANVKSAVTTPGTGIIDRVVDVIPVAWFGGGKHDDFPFGGYGGGTDEAFLMAITMTPPGRRSEVQAAFDAIAQGAGADGPESHTEALFQIMTGAGASWTYTSGGSYSVRRYVGDCLDRGFGAPCFRPGALPIIVHFTDICGHEGPPGEDSGCDPYTGITPAPATWGEAIDEMNARGAKFVGINAAGGAACEPPYASGGTSPCYFLAQTAEATGSIDLDGNFLVFNLPNDSTSAEFIDGVVGGIETVATRVPLDVDTQVRSEGGSEVDTRLFVKRRQPACRADPPTNPCWTPPTDITPDQAIAAIDESTFFGVIPGTSVKFRVTFRNDFVEGGDTAQLFIAFIDVRGGGSTVLDTRQVFIIVPATSNLPI